LAIAKEGLIWRIGYGYANKPARKAVPQGKQRDNQPWKGKFRPLQHVLKANCC
jgi:hypothetical protein